MTVSSYPFHPVLLVDDEPQAVNSFEMALQSERINNCLRCQDSRDVIPLLLNQEIDVILLDLRMPHLSGEELLSIVSSEYPEIPVIVITGANDVDTAVRCMKFGAFDYMVKPVEKSRLIGGVRRAIELRELHREISSLKASVLSGKLQHPEAFADIITNSPLMRSVFQYVEAIAVSPQPVLITGETGVGKEMIARVVHTLSNRSGAFVPVNVAGLDETVFADTLFGHRKGAFTGADQVRSGLVEKASGGTLFLDEIGDLGGELQVKILRLLQESEYFPLGSDIAKRSDARVVAATNHSLQALQKSEQFRKDLYYRLSSHHVVIPPLRERPEDLPFLLEHFLMETAEALGKKKPTPPNELFDLMSSYHFPGNVRELQSMVWDAVSNHKLGKLSLTVFKTHIAQTRPSAKTEFDMPVERERKLVSFSHQLPTLKQSEYLLISEALSRAGGNQAIAALSLGISRQALNKRLKGKKGKKGDVHA
ncbi:MAG: sigma-54-dependent Fis family transcriptional regulator [Deltaproteobacteria bacterium]|nr:sigma-54-dependent Fis family transcriptional regulator [Deltaproteobacteria bacterium]